MVHYKGIEIEVNMVQDVVKGITLTKTGQAIEIPLEVSSYFDAIRVGKATIEFLLGDLGHRPPEIGNAL